MEDYASMTDESLVVACLAMVVIGGLPFLYMFDDKADHSEGGFKRYIWKAIKDIIFDTFRSNGGAKPSEEKPKAASKPASKPAPKKSSSKKK